MSIDSDFAALTFPALRHPNQDALDAQARTQGHAAGYASGLRAAAREAEARVVELNAETAAMLNERNAQLDSALSALEAAARQLHERAIPTIEHAQDVLVSSAIELAEAILGYELADGPRSARAALARVLDHTDPKLLLNVRMNPADVAELDGARSDSAPTASGVEIIADASVARGDALGDFADGYLDARIRTALDRARAALLGETI
ncbi:MAG TPA: FliH/SctL family protein [Lacisediminihabitans sp.]|jgi:flagellar assembly protein FliH|nr:FliH/SctL family protein [Lacisediminihabitans sp.]HXD62170.1 FliH/SctL family protein [Lacisediminihabitans sp.]